ncbi:putative CRISPR-associated protein [Acinetobacter sichuanensis]|uniref:putative CRISPR-associated protein n=1 Tax=Acinetobacter sichuanensis TaxID=2136183 RepID=UPI00280F25B1|nr:putative CRISPR-associated protein [Acinetobacter sichuanensis]MDQ9021839.1 putative CRISPR-associated protein [Acinetobacter sichuanensis]
MPNLIVTTCGTSLFTNGISNELRSEFFKYANHRHWADMPDDVVLRLQQHAELQQQKLLVADADVVKRMSAELNSLLSWQKDKQMHQQDMHILIATDTALGKATAETIENWLQTQGYNVTIISTSGLNTASLQSFREALSGLIPLLIEQVTNYKDSGYQILFNLSGGFKSLNGFLQAFSTIYADETFYIFESSSEVLSIPKLPFYFDTTQIISAHLTAFRRLAAQLNVNKEETNQMPSILLFSIDDEVALSEWGELIWQSSYKALYKSQLFPSISNRISFAPNFESSTKDLDPFILKIVNERIVDLAVFAEGDCKSVLKSVDPKPLQEKQYKDKNLWECDLDPHHRIFMVKDGYSFSLQYVGPALH